MPDIKAERYPTFDEQVGFEIIYESLGMAMASHSEAYHQLDPSSPDAKAHLRKIRHLTKAREALDPTDTAMMELASDIFLGLVDEPESHRQAS